ncbi:RNA polymerase factor sigma-54 [Usitatibacter palustris]|uniref:RNA polymerase sigma-54 factor n=1 Tax=Usitatibacter palustris TaxID=2732487 RepID=A0A6M4H1B8_9PROT|nr:RNA polymerase factor sigma-54 [Usitatibacter palustris]QJR13289.1 RNA polymerase sigma-54 factor [Usitatibacter palustris]
MKHSLQLKLSQHLTLTPQLQQSIRLLQLSTVELNQELERYLAENPLLEREDIPQEESLPAKPGTNPETEAERDGDAEGDGESQAASAPETHEDRGNDDVPSMGDDMGSGVRRDSGDRDDFTQFAAAEPTLQDHLLAQLALLSLTERDRNIAALLVGHLDEDGYFPRDLAELRETMAEAIPELEPEEIDIARRHIQFLEPTGVGARDVPECLALQLRTMPVQTPHRDGAIALVTNHLDVLAARDFNRLKRLLGVDEDELRDIRALILTLDPKPGRAFGAGDVRYVVPDVVVRKSSGRWTATLNRDAMPRLRINKMYADILQASRDNGAKHLAGQLQEARWLIKNVQQRFDTILRVTQAIVDRQKNYFEHGEVAMRPLVLREIAEAVGLHESTISRVTTQKYMFTPRGILELKYFFGSHVSTDTGGSCSATAIRALIKQLVAAEDGKKPLSDHRISDILAQQGIQVARRTVAKYREALQIQPANLRKSI